MRTWMAMLLVAASPALADTVLMKDGSVRHGTIVSQSGDEILLQVNRDGIKATMSIPAEGISKTTREASPPPDTVTPALSSAAHSFAPRGQLPENKTPSAATETPTSTRRPTTASLPPTRGFFIEFAASAAGKGPDDPGRLPDDLRELWENALRSEAQGKNEDLLENLRALHDAFSPVPGGMERLEAVCQRDRKESFAMWFARVHWEAVADKHIGGKFEFGEVRDSERKALIGILKERTGPALEPLKPYFPPVDPKTGKPERFRPAHLQGITISNAIEVKRAASFASAVLLAQLQLEPTMPSIDKLYIGSQLTHVRRIMGRAGELEPAAKAALERAAAQERMKK